MDLALPRRIIFPFFHYQYSMSAAFPTRRGVTSFIMNTSVHSFHAENNSFCHINNANIRTIAAVLEKKNHARTETDSKIQTLRQYQK